MRIRRFNRSTRSQAGGGFSPISSVALIILGFIVSIHFTIDIVILSNTYHYFTTLRVLSLIGALIGYPMILSGLISLFIRKNTSHVSSSVENDVSRIRFAAERSMFKDNK